LRPATVSLTGLLGFISPELRNLVEGGRYAWTVQPAITLPIFTAGRLQANLAASEASQRIALEQYRQAVRNAFRDVEDALAGYRGYREQRDALTSAVNASRERLRLTDLRYVNGVSSYFEVLDSQRELFDLELALSQSTRAVYASIVQFYRSLGGGWDPAYDPTAAPQARAAPISEPAAR
jgi:multidrug efflux system outer membrane protein